MDTIKALEGIVDIYLPDFKYMDPVSCGKIFPCTRLSADSKGCNCRDGASAAPAGVCVGRKKRGEDVPEEACEGAVMKRGVIVRQLLLPGCLKDARNIVRYLYETYQNKIYVSLMSQYTPLEHVRDYPELAHRVSRRTYDRYVDVRLRLELPRLSFRSRGWQKKVLFRIFQMQKACEIIGKMCKIDWFF